MTTDWTPPANPLGPARVGNDLLRLQQIGAGLRQAFDVCPSPQHTGFDDLLRRIDEKNR